MLSPFMHIIPAAVLASLLALPHARAATRDLAPRPPMGWNSYDTYGGDVNEAEVRANAVSMAKNLKQHGWNYVVVDFYWYFEHPEPDVILDSSWKDAVMDQYGRLMPAVNRFPSATGGKGFKPLVDYVHSLGLQFGIHIMRGIPRAAVAQNLLVKGTNAHAADVADKKNDCDWSTVMWGVDTRKAAGQSYYDSIVELYANWGVDFIKADDMSFAKSAIGEEYHKPEIEALHRAIVKSGRRIVLSLSPGPTPLSEAKNVMKYSQMWRISGDFWDNWQSLRRQFDLCRDWTPYRGPNHWPDADMLPLGKLRVRGFKEHERQSRFAPAEKQTMLTLWAIARSPLMTGGDLPSMSAADLALLTNDEVLAAGQNSRGNHELFRRGDIIGWAAKANADGGRQKYLALFNTGDSAVMASVSAHDLGAKGSMLVRDLWNHKDLGSFTGSYSTIIPEHGAVLYRVQL